MKHVGEGTLRALCDNALSPETRARVEGHLSRCSQCAEKASVIRERGDSVHALLSELEPAPEPRSVTSEDVRSQLKVHEQRKREKRMIRNPFSRSYRPAWAVAALVLLTVLTVTVAPLRTMAGELLAVFRVQRIVFTPVDTEAFPEEQAVKALAPEIERMFGDTLAVAAESQPEEVNEADARKRAGFVVRLPVAEEATRHEWTGPMHLAVDIDLPQLRALFAELGYGEIELPAELDGKTVEADFSGIVSSYFGSCEDGPIDQGCMTLVQMASPTVSVPDGLRLKELGRVYLELLGTPASEAAHLSQKIDWTTTLVLPFPHHVNLTHDTLPLDGVEATLIHSESSYRPTPEYLLTWVKGDVIYAVAGEGEYSEALKLAGSLD